MSLPECCLLCLCIIVFSSLPHSLGCNLEGMQVCQYNLELKAAPYTFMFSHDFADFNLHCQQQRKFLACALQKEYTADCNYEDLVDLKALDSAHNALCRDYIKAYNQSRPCILRLHNEVQKCHRPFERAREYHCEELEIVRECVRKAATANEHCDKSDRMFLGEIIDLILKQHAHPDLHNCEMAAFADEIEVTTQQVETTYVTSEATTQETIKSVGSTKVSTISITAKDILPTEKMPIARLSIQMLADDGNSSTRHITSVALMIISLLTVCSSNVC